MAAGVAAAAGAVVAAGLAAAAGAVEALGALPVVASVLVVVALLLLPLLLKTTPHVTAATTMTAKSVGTTMNKQVRLRPPPAAGAAAGGGAAALFTESPPLGRPLLWVGSTAVGSISAESCTRMMQSARAAGWEGTARATSREAGGGSSSRRCKRVPGGARKREYGYCSSREAAGLKAPCT